MRKKDKNVIAINKSAYHEYFMIEKFVAGMVLQGTEIKSIRRGSVNLKGSFARVENGEIFVYNMHISAYEEGNRYNHEEKRTRKLLLNKKEILKITGKIKTENYAIIPTELLILNGKAKLEIALAKGKKLYDKREAIKKRDLDRENKI